MFFTHHLKMFLEGFFHQLLDFFSRVCYSNAAGHIRRMG